jgi:two-component system, chemotaxis family, sensor kinase CheA
MTTGDLREGFFQECEDLLEALSDGMAAMDAGTDDADTVNAVFRAVHSIKGGAAAFGLEALVAFAHSFENVLDAARSGRLALCGPAMSLCFRAGDRLADLVAAARDGTGDNGESAGLIADLDGLLQTGGATQADEAPAEPAADAEEPAFTPLGAALDLPLPGPAPEPGPATGDADAPAVAGPLSYRIRFAPTREIYATGNEPALLFRALSALGTLEVEADLSRIPPLSELAWDEGYMAWTLYLTTEVPEAKLREVFDFVEGACKLEITPPGEPVASAPPPTSVASAPGPAAPSSPDTLAANPGPAAAATSGSGDSAGQAGATRATIRVDLERVDRLINLVGELVINQAMLTQSIEEVNLPSGNGVDSAMGQLRQLSSELQERVMAIRAQPVKPLFQRMSRIVRESAHASQKLARLVTVGETTEVDKTVIERLADPLTHMIRNAVDHGLERPEARRAAGKSDEGTVRLSAAHRSGRVIIELADDGAGIDRAKVREIAVQRGLVPPDKELEDEDIDNLLFMPGFSTSTEVSALSGRGVGMDVVKSEIQRLGGRVSLVSQPGRGTTVSISLPLTLAVLEGMVVEVAGETLVVPTTALQETLKANGADIQRIGAKGWFLSIRGGFVPIVELGARLGFNDGNVDLAGRVLLLVETGSGRRAALAVDRVLDQREVVIKGLENNYGHVPGIAAATILGNGRIALIIDTDEVTAGPTPHPHPAARAEAAFASAAGA